MVGKKDLTCYIGVMKIDTFAVNLQHINIYLNGVAGILLHSNGKE